MIRKIVASLVVLFLFTAATFAQDKAADGAKAVTTHLKTQLLLNDSQYTKVYDINKVFLLKANENNKLAINETEKAKKLKMLVDDKETKLKSVLSDAQFKKYAARRADISKKLKEYYKE